MKPMIDDLNMTSVYARKIRKQQILSLFMIIANLIVWGVGALVMFNCEPKVDPTRHFYIPKGDHYAWPKVSESLQMQKISFDARFDSSAIYDFKNGAIQSDKNKLMGFCDCNSLPHDNSARFGWQWFNNRLEIYAYCYVNGTRTEQFAGVVPIGQYNHYEIEISNDQYIFRLNNEPPVYMKRGSTCSSGLYMKLWPYFGGLVPAPHDVVIDIKTRY